MKILFVIHSLGGGGAEKVLVTVANYLAEEHDVTVMTIVDSGINRALLSPRVKYNSAFSLPGKRREVGRSENTKECAASGSLLAGGGAAKNLTAKVYELFWKIFPTKLLYSHYVKTEYDVEISFLEGICAKFVASSSNPSSKKYCWIHVDVINEPKSHRVFKSENEERRVYSSFDQIVAVSNGVKQSFEQYIKLNNVIVLRNPVDVMDVRNKAKEPLSFDDACLYKGYVFCSIGRLSEQKAFDRLIRASYILKKRGRSFTTLILGEGKLEKDLAIQIKEMGVDDCVHLVGYRANPFPLVAKSDCYVCTSIAEGMSTTISEAMMLNLPIITTKCAGTEELMSVAEGQVVGDSDIEIADAMERAIDEWRDKNRSCSDEVDRFFDKNDSLKAIEALLCE